MQDGLYETAYVTQALSASAEEAVGGATQDIALTRQYKGCSQDTCLARGSPFRRSAGLETRRR